MRRLALIFAIAENGVIGKDGALPWSFPEDRDHFERTTAGHVVIMGRRTWEETGAALPGRTNVVVSRNMSTPRGATVVPSLDAALEHAWRLDEEPFVIGGVRMFEEALPRATRLYVTEIALRPEGDTVLHFDRTRFRVVSERRSPPLRFLVLEP